jgi:hypothetical protein
MVYNAKINVYCPSWNPKNIGRYQSETGLMPFEDHSLDSQRRGSLSVSIFYRNMKEMASVVFMLKGVTKLSNRY